MGDKYIGACSNVGRLGGQELRTVGLAFVPSDGEDYLVLYIIGGEAKECKSTAMAINKGLEACQA